MDKRDSWIITESSCIITESSCITREGNEVTLSLIIQSCSFLKLEYYEENSLERVKIPEVM